jgi:hypothetical protein
MVHVDPPAIIRAMQSNHLVSNKKADELSLGWTLANILGRAAGFWGGRVQKVLAQVDLSNLAKRPGRALQATQEALKAGEEEAGE